MANTWFFKVTCLARHVLATELQFQGAPAFAVEELMQSFVLWFENTHMEIVRVKKIC